MNKKKKSMQVRELIHKYHANGDRIKEIADACEAEKRERTPEESDEVASLVRENDIIHMKVQAASASGVPDVAPDPDTQLRESMANKRQATIVLKREVDIQTSEALADTGIIPIDEQEMLKPLRAGLIYDKVGLNIRTGLSAGKLRWPRHGKAVAQWANEGERLVDAKVDFDKLEVQPVRLGIAIPVTKEELESSQGVVEGVVTEEMPAAIVDAVNEAMFTTEGTYVDVADGKTKNKKVVGPFVEAAKNAVQFAGAVPTRKELLKMKSKVSSSGIKLAAPCWVMTEDMRAELEDTKVDAGSGRFLCENGMILGCPVFTTPSIGEGNVGFGDWSYQAAGFFGQMSLVVDPYSLARNNATDFVLNSHFATATLYQEAFVLGKAKAN